MQLSIYEDDRAGQTARADFIAHLPYRPYCTDEAGNSLLIRGRDLAIRFPLIQPNPPAFVHWLVFDIDHDQAGAAALDAGLPTPAWIAINPENRHAHIAYGLAAPVCKTDAARLKPLRFCAAVERGLCTVLNADPGYCGLIAKNPLHAQWRVLWNENGGRYDLAELAEYINLPNTTPANDSAPAVGLGRNCDLFDSLRFWAYRAIRQGWPDYPQWYEAVRQRAHGLNHQFSTPLPHSEAESTAKSVAKWTHANMTPAGFSESQARRGRKGGHQSIGGGRPKDETSARQRQPWLDLGISKPTYYLRRRQGKL